MISMLIYDRIEKELHQLQESVKEHAAYFGDEHWNIMPARTVKDIMEYERSLSLLETACMDITGSGDLAQAEELRKKYREMFLLIIADTDISPMKYVRPTVMASSLLLRPCREEDIRRITGEFMEAYLEYIDSRQGQSSFVIDSKEGRIHIPFGKIYYFEARDKKLFVQTDREEYGFYGTLDKIQEQLPEYFQRCHRSFIVNTRKVEKVLFSQNMIQLSEGRDVPLARSYKAAFKELGRK